MATATLPTVRAGTPLLADGIRAVNFFNGRLVTSGDMRRDQDARREGDARLGQAIGAGVVHGLVVEAHGAASERRLSVSRGLAVNAAGQTLCLGADQVLALVPSADEDPPETSGGFGACAQLSGGSYVAGDGLYLVTLAPAQQSEGKAAVLALEPGNLRCNTDALVEAVQLRLLRVGDAVLSTHGLDTNAIGLQALSKLRSKVAAACFGLPHDGAAHTHPGTPAGANLLQDMRSRGLAACDVPLAVVFLTAGTGLVFVDRWAVRRSVAPTLAATGWGAWFGDALEARAQAQLAQFQEHLAAIPSSSLGGLQAAQWFAWLPPAGFLDASGTRAVNWETFLGARKPQRTVDLAPGDAPAVLAEALRRDAVPVETGSTPTFRVYAITGGPRLFVRNAPNARHAQETWFDGTRAEMTGVWDVQTAIERLWARSCQQVVLRSGTDIGALQAWLDGPAAGSDLTLCIEAGTHVLAQRLRLRNLRHVVVHGHGDGSRLRCDAGETALLVERCVSATVRGLAVEAGRTERAGEGDISLRGALTVIDTPQVDVADVAARCAADSQLAASAILVGHREPSDDSLRRVRVAHCRLEVGANQQGLSIVHCHVSTVRDNVVAATDAERPMRKGILVVGAVAHEVVVQNNLVVGAAQGINVALSHGDGKGSTRSVRHALVDSNRVQLLAGAEDEDRSAMYHGVFVGNARSLRVIGNHVTASSLPERAHPSRGIYLHGTYGRRVLVRENQAARVVNGIEFVPLGDDMPKGSTECLWFFEENMAEQGEQVLAVEESLWRLLRHQNNVLVPS